MYPFREPFENKTGNSLVFYQTGGGAEFLNVIFFARENLSCQSFARHVDILILQYKD